MITVSDEAQEYILTKGGSIYILHGNGAALCCGRINFGPSVRLGKPMQTKDHILIEMNKINIYLPKDFYTHNPLVVGVGKWPWMTILRIEGWKLL